MISLTKKAYICSSCNKKGTILLAIKRNIDMASEFPKERIEDFESMTPKTLYSYEVIRDEYGVTLYKCAKKIPCDYCGSKEIVWVPYDNEENVLNFYGPGEAGKWFRGFQDLSH